MVPSRGEREGRGGEKVVWSPVEERGREGEESEGAREGMVKLSLSHRSWTLSMQLKYTEGGQVVRVGSQQGHLIFLSVDEGRVGLSLVGQNGTREEVTHTQQLPRNVFTSVVSVCGECVCGECVCGECVCGKYVCGECVWVWCMSVCLRLLYIHVPHL